MIHNFLKFLGIHIHAWHYFTEYDPREPTFTTDFRECAECGTLEQWVVVPAAPGADAAWLEV